MRIGFIGLGAMGWHMAGHLTQLDATVMVWNRTQHKAEAHVAQFATVAVDLCVNTAIADLPLKTSTS